VINKETIPAYIPRPDYLKRITPFIGKSLIKVLTGQRRVGKSFMLYQIMDEIIKQDPEAEILYINKDSINFGKSVLVTTCTATWHRQKKTNRSNVLFIDEIQEITDFETAIRSLLAEGG